MSGRGNGFRLEFVGLKEGKHTFAYDLGEDFMKLFSDSDVFCEPDVHVELSLEKQERMILLDFRFDGTAGTQCDRCLRPLRFNVEVEEKILVKMVSEVEPETGEEDNLWWITEKDTCLDLAPYFYETITLHRPLQVFCPEDENGLSTCDKDMLNLYGQDAGVQETETDPRWDALKELKNKI